MSNNAFKRRDGVEGRYLKSTRSRGEAHFMYRSIGNIGYWIKVTKQVLIHDSIKEKI